MFYYPNCGAYECGVKAKTLLSRVQVLPALVDRLGYWSKDEGDGDANWVVRERVKSLAVIRNISSRFTYLRFTIYDRKATMPSMKEWATASTCGRLSITTLATTIAAMASHGASRTI